jgi:hypothetical protein
MQNKKVHLWSSSFWPLKALRENPTPDSDSQVSITYNKVSSEHRKDEKIEKLFFDWLELTNFKHFLIAV